MNRYRPSILDTLHLLGEEPRKLEDLAEEAGIKAPSMHWRLAHAVADGLVEKSSFGMYKLTLKGQAVAKVEAQRIAIEEVFG